MMIIQEDATVLQGEDTIVPQEEDTTVLQEDVMIVLPDEETTALLTAVVTEMIVLPVDVAMTVLLDDLDIVMTVRQDQDIEIIVQ